MRRVVQIKVKIVEVPRTHETKRKKVTQKKKSQPIVNLHLVHTVNQVVNQTVSPLMKLTQIPNSPHHRNEVMITMEREDVVADEKEIDVKEIVADLDVVNQPVVDASIRNAVSQLLHVVYWDAQQLQSSCL